MKLVAFAGSLFMYFCVGTVLAGVVLLGALWSRGVFTDERATNVLAAVYGLPLPSKEGAAKAAGGESPEQPSFQLILDRRALASLDLDLRENAVDKSLADLRNIELNVQEERRQLDLWKLSFDARLKELESSTADEALQELQRTLEVINPKQAKDQILHMLQTPRGKEDKPLNDIVNIFKAMSLDKRKKIIAEFKSPDETEKLGEILREIRLGMPDSEAIKDSRNQLQQQLNPTR